NAMVNSPRLVAQASRPWLLAGAVLGVSGCLWLAPVWWQGLLLLVLLAGWLWLLPARPRSERPVAEDGQVELQQVQQQLHALRELLDAVLPLWVRHIELVNGQTYSAAEGLTSKFIGMSQQINQVLELGGGQDSGGVFDVLRNAQVEL